MLGRAGRMWEYKGAGIADSVLVPVARARSSWTHCQQKRFAIDTSRPEDLHSYYFTITLFQN